MGINGVPFRYVDWSKIKNLNSDLLWVLQNYPQEAESAIGELETNSWDEIYELMRYSASEFFAMCPELWEPLFAKGMWRDSDVEDALVARQDYFSDARDMMNYRWKNPALAKSVRRALADMDLIDEDEALGERFRPRRSAHSRRVNESQHRRAIASRLRRR